MSSHQGYIVVLRDDLDDEQAEKVITALSMVQGVLSVQPIETNGPDLVARAREFERWRTALVTLVHYGPDAVTDPRTTGR